MTKATCPQWGHVALVGHGGPPPERCGLAVARVEGSMGSHELAKEMETKHPNLYVLKYRVLEPGQDPR
ncbi:hypothetical protein PF008_g7910 [Phytophthora fragariae]|uniref:Uncharacterized protein n=1 Tax=Phytophthora fragariae TaxID=53985 RepID=A0A6G0S1Q6_9STRA|nr:hypothetical protein PF008_g7910 [Phytophthora fragariae]